MGFPQSKVIANRDELQNRYKDFEYKFEGKDVPRPPHWGGYRLVPDYFEFWQGAPGRLHDRLVFRSSGQGWKLERLAP